MNGLLVNDEISIFIVLIVFICLCWADDGLSENCPVLPTGEHEFTFSSKLPPELPSTFLGQYGQIYYVAEIVLQRPSWKSCVVSKKSFVVQTGLDLSFIPEAAVNFWIVCFTLKFEWNAKTFFWFFFATMLVNFKKAEVRMVEKISIMVPAATLFTESGLLTLVHWSMGYMSFGAMELAESDLRVIIHKIWSRLFELYFIWNS